MSLISADDLDRAVTVADSWAVLDLLRGAPEPDRRAVLPALLDLERRVERADPRLLPGDTIDDQRAHAYRMRACALLAVFACATWSEIRARGLDHLPCGCDLVAVLLDRRPSWLCGFGKWIAAPRQLERWWPELRVLEREGLIEVPRTPRYWTCMAERLNGPFLYGDGELIADPDPQRCTRRQEDDRRPPVLVADAFRLDRALSERDVWQMLELDAAVELLSEESAMPLPPIPGAARLDVTLVESGNSGVLSRPRLLEAALDGLARATPKTVRWFQGLLEKLSPSLEEQATARDGYLRLLGARMGAAVDTGLRGVSDMVAAERLETAVLAQWTGPVLPSKSKGQALKGLRLLQQAVGREPRAAPAVAEAALEALQHSAPDVHGAALTLLERLPPHALESSRERLRDCIRYVVPSQRERAESLVSKLPGAQQPIASARAQAAPAGVADLERQAQGLLPEAAARAGIDAALAFARGDAASLPAVPIDDGLSPRLDAANLLSPIDDADSLIDTLLRGLEGGIRADEAELALDAMARMPQDREASEFRQRTAALRQRAEGLLGSEGLPFTGNRPTTDLAGLVLAWSDGRVFRAPGHGYYADSASHVFQDRLRKLALRLASGRPTRLLGTPTHCGGWIDPQVIPRRWSEARECGDEPDVEDQVQALQRLAPDGRSAALATAQAVDGEFGHVLRYALGGEEGEGPTRSLWIVGTKTRTPRRLERTLERPAETAGEEGTASHPSAIRHEAVGGKLTLELPFVVGKRIELSTLLTYMEAEARLQRPTASFDALLVASHELWRDPSPLAASWQASLQPACPDEFFAQEGSRLKWSLDQTRVQWSGEWELFFDPELPAVSVARALLVCGLSARHPGISGLARDALIALIADGRLAASALGATLQVAIEGGTVSHSRWLAAFRDVSGVSALHLWVLHESLARAVAVLPAKPAGTASALLELLYEWSLEAEQAITYPPSRSQLQSMSVGKVGRIAQALLALEANPASRIRREAARLAVEHRLERARRYEGRLLAAR